VIGSVRDRIVTESASASGPPDQSEYLSPSAMTSGAAMLAPARRDSMCANRPLSKLLHPIRGYLRTA